MRLILVGCEYAGKTTLVSQIKQWIERTMGPTRGFHDHFTVPMSDVSEKEQEQFLSLSPRLQEMFQRYMIEYHLQPAFYSYPDHLLVGFHIEEAVYAPLYYGYGREGEYTGRTTYARNREKDIMEAVPDTVLILIRAEAQVIAKRMRENAHPRGVVQEKDIPHVLQRFEEECQSSLIGNQFALDSTTATVEETLKEFVAQIEPYLTDTDRLRILTRRTLQK